MKVSALLCVLNEESNIKRIIDSLLNIEVDEIIIVDGGSEDNTISLINNYGEMVKLFFLPNEGKLRQSLFGITKASFDLVLIVDADDLISANDFKLNLNLLIETNSDGVQFSYLTDQSNYWSKLWSNYLKVVATNNKKLVVLGRPCITRKNILAQFDYTIAPLGILHDDSWIFEKTRQDGLKYLSGSGKTLRLQPRSLKEILQKSFNYGLHDGKVIIDNKVLYTTIYHQLIRYPLIYASKGLYLYGISTALLIIFVGYLRFMGTSKYLSKIYLFKN